MVVELELFSYPEKSGSKSQFLLKKFMPDLIEPSHLFCDLFTGILEVVFMGIILFSVANPAMGSP